MDSVIISGICRCCSSEGPSKDLTSAYHWMGEEEIYEQMLRDCFSIALSAPDDDRSFGGICEVCITQLRNAYNFKKQVVLTEDMFKKRLTGALKTVKVEVSRADADTDSDGDFGENDNDTDYDVPIKMEEEFLEDELEVEKPKKRAAKAQPSTSKAKKPMQEAESSKSDDKKSDESGSQYKILCVNGRKEYRCIRCGQTLCSLSKFKIHMQRIHQCPHCPETFDSRVYKITHIKQAHSSGMLLEPKSEDSELECDFCIETFGTEEILLEHLKTHDEHNNQPDVFEAEFMSEEELLYLLQVHADDSDSRKRSIKSTTRNLYDTIVNEDGGIKYRCNVCQAVLNSFTTHFNNIHKCSYCPLIYSSRHLKTQHLKEDHKDEYDNLSKPGSELDSHLPSKTCQKVFKDKKKLTNHLRTTYRETKCNECGMVFEKQNQLERHKFEEHDKRDNNIISEPGPELDPPLRCETCQKVFKDKKKFKRHLRTHLEAKCMECGMVFEKQNQLERHKFEEHGKRFACGICDFETPKQCILKSHQRRVHLQEKNVKCDFCDQAFFDGSGLKNHMVKHTQEKKYPCRFCSKVFTRPETIKYHERSHTGDKRKVCKICKAAFVQKASLSHHMKKHHPECL